MSEAILTHIQRHEGDWEAQFYSSLFQQHMTVYVLDLETSINKVEQTIQQFNNLRPDLLARLYQFSWDYCKCFCDYVGDQDCPDIQQPSEILQYIQPMALHVETHPDRTDIIIRVELNCDWEVEHGLEWLIRDQQILYVGSCEMPDAWQEISYYQNYDLNFAYGNNYDNL